MEALRAWAQEPGRAQLHSRLLRQLTDSPNVDNAAATTPSAPDTADVGSSRGGSARTGSSGEGSRATGEHASGARDAQGAEPERRATPAPPQPSENRRGAGPGPVVPPGGTGPERDLADRGDLTPSEFGRKILTDAEEIYDGLPAGTLPKVLFDFGRLIPALAIGSGLASDLIEGYHNLSAAYEVKDVEGGEELFALVVLRQGIQNGSSVLNGVGALTEILQDAAFAVPGVNVVAIVGNLVHGAVLTFVDGLKLALDVAIHVQAKEMKTGLHAKSPHAKQLASIEQTFGFNAVTDGISVLIDMVDFVTASVAHGSNLKAVKKVIESSLKLLSVVGSGGVALLQFVLATAPSIFDSAPSEDTEAGRGATRNGVGILRAAAGESHAVLRLTKDQVDTFVEGATAAATALAGGRDPFVLMRDGVREGLENAKSRGLGYAEIDLATEQAQTAMQAAADTLPQARSQVDALVAPRIPVPATAVGDSAAPIKAVVEAGTAPIADLIAQVQRQLDTAVDSFRAQATTQLDASEQQVQSGLEWAMTYRAAIAERRAEAEEAVALFTEQLGKCQNVEEVFDTVIREVALHASQVEGIDLETVEAYLDLIQELAARADTVFEGPEVANA
jgi:hypothetical protein